MQCASFQEQLSEFLDGDLGGSDRQNVEKHLRTCAVCSTVRDDLARLIAASATLPLHTPSAAVWSKIEREIDGGLVIGPSAWWNRLSAHRYDFSVSARQIVAVAATVVVAAGTFWAIQYTSPNALPSLDVNWNTMGGTTPGVTAVPLAHVTPTDEVSRVRSLIDEMSSSLVVSQATWSPELKTTFAKSTAAADARITDAERAHAVAPTDATREIVVAMYREKLRLLDEFARLAAEPVTPSSK